MSNLPEKEWFNYNSRSQKVRLLIFSIVLAILLGHAWYVLLFVNPVDGSHYVISWRHYIGLLFFLPVPYFYISNKKLLVVYLGVYVLLATLGIAGITYFYTDYWGFSIGSADIKIPLVQPLPLVLLFIYFCLNATALFNIELDYKEKRKSGTVKK